MTNRLEIRFHCDRCAAEDVLPAGGKAHISPEGWTMLRVGDPDDGKPAMHVCPSCSLAFSQFMDATR